jgi:hypothetical protein
MPSYAENLRFMSAPIAENNYRFGSVETLALPAGAASVFLPCFPGCNTLYIMTSRWDWKPYWFQHCAGMCPDVETLVYKSSRREFSDIPDLGTMDARMTESNVSSEFYAVPSLIPHSVMFHVFPKLRMLPLPFDLAQDTVCVL